MLLPLKTRRFCSTLLAIAALAATPAREAAAGAITVAWDRNPEPDVAGYIVYIGSSPGDRATAIDVGDVNSYTFTPDGTSAAVYVTVAAYLPGVTGPVANEVVARINVAPIVSAPGNPTGTVGTPLSLTLSAIDRNDDPITLTAAGLPPGLSMSGAGTITGTPTTAGSYQTSVTARDPSGDLSSVTFGWQIAAADLQPPTLMVSAPTATDGHRTTESFVTVTGTASDDIGVSSVEWMRDGSGGVAAGTREWSVIVPLVLGDNAITIAARDAAGRVTSRVLTVVYQPPAPSAPPTPSAEPQPTSASALKPAPAPTPTKKPPSLDVKSITASKAAPGNVGKTVTFTANFKGGIAPHQFQWLVHDGKRWTVMQTWSDSPVLTWTPSAKNKDYRVRVWARSAGNTKDAAESGAQRTIDYEVKK